MQCLIPGDGGSLGEAELPGNMGKGEHHPSLQGEMPQEMEQLCQEAEEAPLRALILCRSSGQSKDVSCLSHAASISRLYKV